MVEIISHINPNFAELYRHYRYKALYGGRGSGKSHGISEALVLKAYGSGKEGLRIMCGREKQNSIKESVINLIKKKIKQLKLQDFFTTTNNEIRANHNGSYFFFTGLYQKLDSIQSIEGVDICWIEEAHTLSQETINILLPTIREQGSELWFSWNPKTPTDPIGQMFLNDPPPSSFIKKLNYYDNPWFPQELDDLKNYDKKRDYDRYRHIWLGEPVVHTEFQVFKNWRVDNFVTPEGTDFLFGADWGFSNDPAVLVRCFIDEENRKLFIDQEAYGLSVEISDTPAFFDQVPESRKWTITADSARPEIISHMNNNGFKIKSAKKGPGSIESGVKFLQDFDIIVHERCNHTADELALYSYVKHKQTGKPTPKLEDKHNHCLDSIRYLLEDVQHNKIKDFRIKRVC